VPSGGPFILLPAPPDDRAVPSELVPGAVALARCVEEEWCDPIPLPRQKPTLGQAMPRMRQRTNGFLMRTSIFLRPTPAPAPHKAAFAAEPKAGDYVVQAGAYSTSDRATHVAYVLGGKVSPAGHLFRVRTGPFATHSEAEASLAKVRAAGYTDARIQTSG